MFSVIDTFACPNISDSDFTSTPSSIQRVANVCLSAWKFTGLTPAVLSVLLYRYSNVRGLMKHWEAFGDTYPFDLRYGKLSMIM